MIMKSIPKIAIFLFLLITYSELSVAQKQGIAAIDSMKLLLKKNKKTDSNSIRTILKISKAYGYINTDSATHFANLGLTESKKINWQKGIAANFGQLGSLHNENSNYEKALAYYNKALAINKSINNKTGQAGNIINIGVVYDRQGNTSKALDNYFKALKIAQEIKDDDYTALIYCNIADVYMFNKNNRKALDYALKGFEKYEKLKDLNGIAHSSNRVGTTYYVLKNFEKAEQYFKKSLNVNSQLENKMGQAQALGNIALLHEDNLDMKLDFLLKSQQLNDEINSVSSQSITNLGNIGGTYALIFIKRLKDKYPTQNFIPNDYPTIYQKAIYYLKKAVQTSKEVGDQGNLSYFSDNLAQLQEYNGQHKDALLNYKISKNIDDSLYSQESKNQIATLEAQFAFQKKEDHYKQQQELAKVRAQQIYLYAGLAIVLVSSVLLYLLNRSNIKQLRLKNQLIRKEAEEQTKELLHQSKLIESELKAIRSQMNPHFIFNVLNSIEAYIMDNDKQTASRLIQKFAALSRLILENSTKSLVTADREWKALKLYTELEAMRYNNSFSFNFDADESLQLKTLLLPPMLIQPLIENAILHGLIVNPKPGAHLEVQLKRHDQGICITVEDNGSGLDHQPKTRTKTGVKEKSMGLASIKERIAMINAQKNNYLASFKIIPRPKGEGTFATILLPNFDNAVA